MQEGVKFVINNFEKSLKLATTVNSLAKLKPRIISEYNHISKAKKTGDLYRHFLTFKSGKHKYADDFAVFRKYNILPNEEIADYLYENYPDEVSDYTKVSDFIIGQKYNNSDIRFGFGCTYMGGIRPSNKTNTIVIIANHVKSIYEDGWKGNTLFYTGEGTRGDQELKGKNLSINRAKEDNRSIHLFEVFKEKEYTYKGEVELTLPLKYGVQPDETNVYRQVILFPLKLKDNSISSLVNIIDIKKQEEYKHKKANKLGSDILYAKAKEAGETVKREVKTTYIYRNPFVSEQVKRRANGKCELCGMEAPFKKRNGEPYLEVHHVITLSKDGPDSLINTVALCPNCHRKVHYGTDDLDEKLLIKVIMSNLQNERKLLDEAKILFNVGDEYKEEVKVQ